MEHKTNAKPAKTILAQEKPILEGRAVVEAGWGKVAHRNHQKANLQPVNESSND